MEGSAVCGQHDRVTRMEAFPRRRVRASRCRRSPSNEGCRECQALAAPLARQQQEKQAAVTTGSAETPRHSLRDGFTAYTSSPWGPGFLAPIAALTSSAQLSLSVGRPGPHDFTVRVAIARPATSTRPSHPRLTCRDDRDTPSSSRRDAGRKACDSEKRKQYFCTRIGCPICH